MINTNNLDELIRIFLTSKEKGLQLDFHRESEEVLFQFFKQKDMVNWDIDFELNDKVNGYCVFLFFNNQKTNNELNLNRLLNYYDFKNYIYSKSLGGIDAYFKLDNNHCIKDIVDYTSKIIKDVYDYEGLVKYRLNAY